MQIRSVKQFIVVVLVIAIPGIAVAIFLGGNDGSESTSRTTDGKVATQSTATPVVVVKEVTPTNSPEPTFTSAVTEVNITAQALIELYDSNPIAADAKYKGTIANIEGTINSIAQAGKYVDVKLTGRGSYLADVVCKVSDANSVLGLQSGQPITVHGLIAGVTGIVDIVVHDCSVSEPATVGTPGDKPTTLPGDVIDATARELIDSYASNPVDANVLFMGRVANITGIINSIRQSGGEVNVKLTGPKRPESTSIAEVVCKTTDIDWVIELLPEQQITVTGKIAGVSGVMDIVVENCTEASSLAAAEYHYLQGMNALEMANTPQMKKSRAVVVEPRVKWWEGISAPYPIAIQVDEETPTSWPGDIWFLRSAIEEFHQAIVLDANHGEAKEQLQEAYNERAIAYEKLVSEVCRAPYIGTSYVYSGCLILLPLGSTLPGEQLLSWLIELGLPEKRAQVNHSVGWMPTDSRGGGICPLHPAPGNTCWIVEIQAAQEDSTDAQRILESMEIFCIVFGGWENNFLRMQHEDNTVSFVSCE